MDLRVPIWHQLLLQIYKHRPKQRYISRINKKIRGSHAHLRSLLQRMEENGLVVIIPVRNKRMLQLTERGERVALALLTIKREINTHTSRS